MLRVPTEGALGRPSSVAGVGGELAQVAEGDPAAGQREDPERLQVVEDDVGGGSGRAREAGDVLLRQRQYEPVAGVGVEPGRLQEASGDALLDRSVERVHQVV